MDLSGMNGRTVIINAVMTDGETKYSIGIDGKAMSTKDKVKWEATVQQLRDAGAIIVDNAAKKAEEDAAIAAMRAKAAK